MNLLEAIILGIVQGLTEFIPVSSSGHLVIMQEFMGVQEAGLAFDVALHIGTLLALCIYFRNEVKLLVLGLLGMNGHKRLAWLIILATVPAVIAGMVLQDAAEGAFRSIYIVAFNLAAVGLLMIMAENFARRFQHPLDDLKQTSRGKALLIGMAQILALVPGVSRSGITITFGLFAGFGRVAATRFSFFLAIPVTFGAIIKVLSDGTNLADIASTPDIFIAGIAAALGSGLIAIRFLINYLAKHSLRAFAYYRLALALTVVLFSVMR